MPAIILPKSFPAPAPTDAAPAPAPPEVQEAFQEWLEAAAAKQAAWAARQPKKSDEELLAKARKLRASIERLEASYDAYAASEDEADQESAQLISGEICELEQELDDVKRALGIA